MDLSSSIEAILWYKGEPITKQELSSILNVDETEIEDGVMRLREVLKERGVRLVAHEGKYEIKTAPEMSEYIEAMEQKERSTPLSKSARETLSVIVYGGGATKAEIDYIRGVDTRYMLRNLMLRNLIEKEEDPNDKRSPRYLPTLDLLASFGVSSIEELEGYNELFQEIAQLKERYQKEENHDTTQES